MAKLPVDSPYLVPFDGSFRVEDSPTLPDEEPQKKPLKKRLRKSVKQLYELQRRLFAENRRAVLCVFQGLDASGKDSTIRNVFSGINPAGVQVMTFKRPSARELDHDYLWRSAQRVPERGRIGVFNRSHYEEVLVIRVHPELLQYQRIPEPRSLDALWDERYHSIRESEKHLARNGTVILKFWLHHSRDEQRRRFLDRLDTERKQWKFDPNDVRERGFWDEYMAAYEDALNGTSRKYAPWYAIPADSKPYARATVADIVVRTLQTMDPQYPPVDPDDAETFEEMRALLLADDGKKKKKGKKKK